MQNVQNCRGTDVICAKLPLFRDSFVRFALVLHVFLLAIPKKQDSSAFKPSSLFHRLAIPENWMSGQKLCDKQKDEDVHMEDAV